MADEPNEDVLELTADQQIDGDDQEQTKPEPQPEGDDEEEVLEFEGEAAPASGDADSSVIRDLRRQHREAMKRIAELEKVQPSQAVEIGPKPTLESCEYDEDRFEAELDGWKERTRKAETAKTDAQRQQEAAQAEFAKDVERFNSGRTQLRFTDANEAVETASAALSDVQQAVIVKAAENPALVVYALGKHPAKLAQLSQIHDPIKLAAAVAKLEGPLKVTKRKRAPAPEEIASGNASVSAGSTDKELERLEKEALRTGDRTKVQEYKRSLKSKA